MTKHKHYDEIIAFANGKTIQWCSSERGADWMDIDHPLFREGYEYRVKPADIIKYAGFTRNDSDSSHLELTPTRYPEDILKLTFDRYTKVLKSAELL